MAFWADLDSTEKALVITSATGVALGVTGVALGAAANTRCTRTERAVTGLEGRMTQAEATLGISQYDAERAAQRAQEQRAAEGYFSAAANISCGRGSWKR
jgi:hypothetical protein